MDNTAQSTDPAAAQRFCSQCDKPLDLGAAFCGNCGAAQAGGSASYPAVPSPSPGAVTSKPKQDWKKYSAVLAIGFGMLWKYKFALFVLLRSISLFGRHVR